MRKCNLSFIWVKEKRVMGGMEEWRRKFQDTQG